MISKALQEAIDQLQIADVYLRDHTAKCFGDFNPKHAEGLDDLTLEFMHYVKNSAVYEASDNTLLLLVQIRLGTRWVEPTEVSDEDSEEKEPLVKAMVEAEYTAEYQMSHQLGEESINEFSLKNASVHVWPYYRALLAAQCDRMNLPKVVLPAVQFARNKDGDTQEPEV